VIDIRDYEVMYILDTALPEEETGTMQERFAELVRTHGGEVKDVVRWDTRRLAYEIKGKREGNYVIMTLTAGQEAMSELHRSLRLSEQVLRHMIVRTDGA